MNRELERIGEKCGLFAYFGESPNAAFTTYYGLFALQHRGQESAGIGTVDSSGYYLHKDMGTVISVFSTDILKSLPGNIAVGHDRYSTNGASAVLHAQPIIRCGRGSEMIIGAHNGNLHDTSELREGLEGTSYSTDGENDSELTISNISYLVHVKGARLEDAVAETYRKLKGGFFMAVATKNKLVAFRDGYGIRPGSIGRLENGFIFASETCAIDDVHGTFVRDVKPGEIVTIQDGDLKSVFLGHDIARLATLCLMEYQYFMRPDSLINGRMAYAYRRELGRALARECPADADIVLGVPNSALPGALGYSEFSGIPFGEGGIIRKKSKTGSLDGRFINTRSFIAPDQAARERIADGKYEIDERVVKGKRVVVVDDSLLRKTTMDVIAKKLHRVGVREIHARIHTPRIGWRDPYGISIQTRGELFVNRFDESQFAEVLGVTSVEWISREATLEVIGEENVTDHIVTGNYPDSFRDVNDRDLVFA